jgi:hypothetical protein
VRTEYYVISADDLDWRLSADDLDGGSPPTI